MTTYFIEESSELGQFLEDLSCIPITCVGEEVTKTYILEQLDEVIRTAKYIKNGIKNKVGELDLDKYKVM